MRSPTLRNLFTVALASSMGLSCQAPTPTASPESLAEADAAAEQLALEAEPQLESFPGLLPVSLDREGGRVFFDLPAPGSDGVLVELLHVVGITTGVGSNELGLDRGSVAGARLIRFRQNGPRVSIEQPNLDFRAVSADPDERRAARESYATSVVWSTDAVELSPDTGLLRVDVTDWIVADRYGVARRLAASGQGRFTFDADRSALDADGILVFPDNLEFDARITLTSDSPGGRLRGHVPDPSAVTLVQHHSFIRLPDEGYQARDFDTRTGSFSLSFVDHAVSLDAPLVRRFALRHRLRRRDPSSPTSPIVEPITFYVDRGAPEPVRTALIEGASWWTDAFAAAGFDEAFKVELLPVGAHPLDVRFNVIQWVHRSTRGWSYGNAVHDPRTGEILKGHVTLGSQRVRQDRMIFEGMVGAQRTGTGASNDPIELSLARLRQLAAHEVGHALGLAHNFSGSAAGRASVMDYPAPRIRVREDDRLDFGDAYAEGIGSWDRYAIAMLYGDRPTGQRGRDALDALVRNARERGLRYHSDSDARSAAAAIPSASLWDDGPDAIASLEEALEVREVAIDGFGRRCLGPERPLGELERVFIPLYFYHRYQVTAVAKTLGGLDYQHTLANDLNATVSPISGDRQRAALEILVRTLTVRVLDIPDGIVEQLAPLPPGYGGSPEDFAGRTGGTFDSMSVMAAATRHTVAAMLQPQRLQRMVDQQRRDPGLPGIGDVLRGLLGPGWFAAHAGQSARDTVTRALVGRVILEEMMRCARDPRSAGLVRERLDDTLQRVADSFGALGLGRELSQHLQRPAPAVSPGLRAPDLPPGPPIGSGPHSLWGACGCGG